MQALIALLCSIISKLSQKKRRETGYKSAREITLHENRNSIRRSKISTSSALGEEIIDRARGKGGGAQKDNCRHRPPKPVDALFYPLLIIYSVAINQWSATRPRRATGRPCKCRCTERIRARVRARAHTRARACIHTRRPAAGPLPLGELIM